jgi:hypothetical protein
MLLLMLRFDNRRLLMVSERARGLYRLIGLASVKFEQSLSSVTAGIPEPVKRFGTGSHLIFVSAYTAGAS